MGLSPDSPGVIADADWSGTGKCNRLIVRDGASADPDGANQNALLAGDGQTPGKEIKAWLECSMSKSEPPGCCSLPVCPAGMPEKTDVFAFLMAISILPTQASSMRECFEAGARIDGNAHSGAGFRGTLARSSDGTVGVRDCDMHDCSSPRCDFAKVQRFGDGHKFLYLSREPHQSPAARRLASSA